MSLSCLFNIMSSNNNSGLSSLNQIKKMLPDPVRRETSLVNQFSNRLYKVYANVHPNKRNISYNDYFQLINLAIILKQVYKIPNTGIAIHTVQSEQLSN